MRKIENGIILGVNFNPVKFNKQLLKFLPLRSVRVLSVELFQLPCSMNFLQDVYFAVCDFLKFAGTNFSGSN